MASPDLEAPLLTLADLVVPMCMDGNTGTALVTGASSGIGRALAKLHASRGGDLIVAARREQELQKLASEVQGAHKVTVHVVPCDLAGEAGAKTLYDEVKKLGVRVDILVNNAGFGGHGHFVERDLDAELKMIDLNIKALVALSHLVGKDMVQQGGGKMLQVGSTAGFMPGPNQAIYFATKAFVNSFSQALDQELRPSGVTSTVLCPGYVETEFADAANLRGTDMVKAGGATPESVARCGYDAMMKGKLVTITDKKLSFMLGWVAPFMPRRAMLKMVEKSQSK